ncbi:GNAT family N-acetyltransferase [Chitinimonas sp.]|uniref:GNAT family N-acetyltransferase n=1 Tax=Chitinimonas sp. TaxID=1934313 RepID=UPI002F935E83
MLVLQTDRLQLRQLTLDDAAFMLRLLNEPSWLRYIGDRNVHTLEEARQYLLNGPLDSYARLGFGFYLVADKATGTTVGMCGLAQRDYLDDPDIGYALLPEHSGQGYVQEAAQAVLAYARDMLHLPRLLATVRPDNAASIKVLDKLGMQLARRFYREADQRELLLYAIELHRD